MVKEKNKTKEKELNKKTAKKAVIEKSPEPHKEGSGLPVVNLPAKLVQALADEVARNVVNRLPGVPKRESRPKKQQKIENAFFLDTSAIIDGRIFDIINLGLIAGVIAIPESILLELKHIADSQDMVKRERGRKGLELLDKLERSKAIKIIHIPDKNGNGTPREVDEKLIEITKLYKGRLITCDYNLEKKASISGIKGININTLANYLKIRAVPGEALHIRVLHIGKDSSQGVGYLDDGTMLVVEHGSGDVGKEIDVIVSRVIQTSAGKILFSKKI